MGKFNGGKLLNIDNDVVYRKRIHPFMETWKWCLSEGVKINKTLLRR